MLVPSLLKQQQTKDQVGSDLGNMLQNIEFKTVTSDFQSRLSDDVRKIKKNSKFLLSAGKTTNFYEPITAE